MDDSLRVRPFNLTATLFHSCIREETENACSFRAAKIEGLSSENKFLLIVY